MVPHQRPGDQIAFADLRGRPPSEGSERQPKCRQDRKDRPIVASKAERQSAPSFAAMDVETANASRDSICQIGIVHVRDGQIEEQWKTLVDPETWFDDLNVEIHGIDEEDVWGSPVMPGLEVELRRRLNGYVVSHSTFDSVA